MPTHHFRQVIARTQLSTEVLIVTRHNALRAFTEMDENGAGPDSSLATWK